MTKKYIGFTIGPIDRLQSYAKKTRGIWASSYLFSYIVKNIARKYFIDGYEFIKPTVNVSMFTHYDIIEGIKYKIINDKIDIKSLEEKCYEVIHEIFPNRGDLKLEKLPEITGGEDCKSLGILINRLARVISLLTFGDLSSLNKEGNFICIGGYTFKKSPFSLFVPTPEDIIDAIIEKDGEEKLKENLIKIVSHIFHDQIETFIKLSKNSCGKDTLTKNLKVLYEKCCINDFSSRFFDINKKFKYYDIDYSNFEFSLITPYHLLEGICAKELKRVYENNELLLKCNTLISTILKNLENDKPFIKEELTSSKKFEDALLNIFQEYTSNDIVGRFPDQLIFKNDKGLKLEDVRRDCDEFLEILSNNIALVLGKSQTQVYNYVRQNIRIILFEQEFEDSTENSNIIKSMQDTMNIMECRDQFSSTEEENYLADYIENASSFSLIINEVFPNKNSNLFNTIIECSTGGEYIKTDDDKEKRKLTKKLIDGGFDNILKPYQKYIAMVTGDGDNFGKTLARLGSNVSGVFKVINDKIKRNIESYGGQLVYQGGDDVFFFAPVYNPLSKLKNEDPSEQKYISNIFSLLNKISCDIQDEIKSNKEIKALDKKPSFSFGVSISYHKYPAAESKQKSEELLSEIKKDEHTKNKINWVVRKHSGSTFGGILDKNKPEEGVSDFENFLNFITKVLDKVDNEDVEILHSVTFWLDTDHSMLSYILLNPNRKTLLNNYIDANFNEAVHKGYKEFFESVKRFLLAYNDDKGIEKLNVAMRYITLLLKDNE